MGRSRPSPSATSYIPVTPFHGDSLVEEKIADNNVVVRATMTSLSSEVIADANSKYRAILKFNLNASEYLGGTGPSSIVAVWVDGRPYDARDKANDAKAGILIERDDQWDDREALIFLFDGANGFGTSLDGQLQLADHFLLALGHRYLPDDRYSLHSKTYKAWLRTLSSAGSTGEKQEFLMDVAGRSSTTPTITLGNLKIQITEVIAELDGGDGLEAYDVCIREKYRFERTIRYFRDVEGRDVYDKSPQDSNLVSGQPANYILHQRQNGGVYPSKKARTWLEGRDST